MVLRGTANPVAPAGTALYHCEVTNRGVAGVKIARVTIFNPQSPPGKPVPLQLPEGEQPRRLENGDSQTWSTANDATDRPWIVEQEYSPHPSIRLRVTAFDTLGNSYEAKDPEPYPYHCFLSQVWT